MGKSFVDGIEAVFVRVGKVGAVEAGGGVVSAIYKERGRRSVVS